MQKDYSAYLTNALSCDVAATADLIYYEVPHIVKKHNLWLSDNVPIIPPFHAEKKRTQELWIANPVAGCPCSPLI